jgi:FkbM family methyltransferase
MSAKSISVRSVGVRNCTTSTSTAIALVIVVTFLIYDKRSKHSAPLHRDLREILALSSNGQRGMGIGLSAAYAGGPLFYYVTNHPTKDFVSNAVVATGVFDREVTSYVKQRMFSARMKYNVEDILAVDVGANIGCTVTLPIAAEGFNVASFEMQPSVAKRLELALKLNDWNDERVLLFNRGVAVGGDSVCVEFNQDAGNLGNVGGTPGAIADRNFPGCIRGIRIDDAIGYKRRIPVMKIDVEGMEIEALQSSRKLFKRNLVDEIVVELRPIQIDVFMLLLENGFNHIQRLDVNGTKEVWSEKEVDSFTTGKLVHLPFVNLIFQKRQTSRIPS